MGFRTKEQKQAEARQYARRACPYGDAQVDETLNYPPPTPLWPQATSCCNG